MKTRAAFIVVCMIVLYFLVSYLPIDSGFEQQCIDYTQVEFVSVRQEVISEASMNVPAVSENRTGIVTNVLVQVMPGTGRILTNIDKILFWADTQDSIRKATKAAERHLDMNISEYDLIYTITADAAVIEGPSAGAALAITTIAALENREVNQSVMITGTIDEQGNIGKVGGINEKVGAAISNGVELFFIPKGNVPTISGFGKEKVCRSVGGFDVCEVRYLSRTHLNLSVKEVNNINQTLEYFLI